MSNRTIIVEFRLSREEAMSIYAASSEWPPTRHGRDASGIQLRVVIPRIGPGDSIDTIFSARRVSSPSRNHA